jgi:hypothetical protein
MRIKFLISIIILIVTLGCSSENNTNQATVQSENINSEKIIYAYSFQWSFDMKLVPTHQFENSKISNAYILKIEYKNNKPFKIIWLHNNNQVQMSIMGKFVYSINFEYKENEMIQTYLDLNQNPVNDNFGICKIITKFDNNGNKTAQIFYNKSNENVKDEYGNYQYIYKKGNQNNEHLSFALDKSGKKVEFAEGGYELDFVLDKNGVVIKNIWKNSNGEIIKNKKGYAISELKYDDKYQLVEFRYLDEKQKLTINTPNHCAYLKFKYDKYGNKIETRFFNINNELTNDFQSGCAIFKIFWNNGQPIKVERIDKEGEIIN